ncbi:hypothetical protein Ddye_004280 [Dipteronia dyeriana]|uniref:DUF241 domain protein n=1 Tax=Dipteronia dyeriana TaxID=168575 RepID=A0AAD9XUH0_9ROSI|nr:hypothetical protein Ddye_004280 [Dipteronia dyeriana]
MASSPLNTKSQFHARSNSLPSRPHPFMSRIDEQLCRLRATEASSSSISIRINGLTDLYDLVDNFLLLPETQATLAQERHEKQVDEVLDRSLRLMDVCGNTKDSLLKIKEETQELQSILRRRRGDESKLVIKVGEYLSSKKKANKVIRKSLKDLKSICVFSSLDNEATTINILREVDGVTFQVFDSLLSNISGSKLQSKSSGWSLVSKSMKSKRITCEEATEVNGFEKVDATLSSLIGNKSGNMNAENAQNVLGKLESCIQDLEEGFECLRRRLIKTRVILLNILNH